MPKDRKQGMVFGVIMSYAMAYGMEIYNIAIKEGIPLFQVRDRACPLVGRPICFGRLCGAAQGGDEGGKHNCHKPCRKAVVI